MISNMQIQSHGAALCIFIHGKITQHCSATIIVCPQFVCQCVALLLFWALILQTQAWHSIRARLLRFMQTSSMIQQKSHAEQKAASSFLAYFFHFSNKSHLVDAKERSHI